MQKLNEQDLLNWFKEMNVSEYHKNDSQRRIFDIHYTFMINDMKFSIISWEQYTEKQAREYREAGLKMESDNPLWEIYCFNVDNDVERSKELNDFKEFIKNCFKLKEIGARTRGIVRIIEQEKNGDK